MTDIKKILVGIDFSEASEAALRRAVMIGNREKAALSVLHVLRDFPYEAATGSLDQVELMGQLEKEASEQLVQWMHREVKGEMEVKSRVRVGIPDHDLLLASKEYDANLLVLGSRGKGLLKNLILGSVVETVARKSLIPLWIERGKGSEPITEILIPTDMSRHAESGVLLGLDWARRWKAKVILLHVVETPYIPSFSLIDPEDYEKQMFLLAQQHFETYLKTLPLSGIEYQSMVESGETISKIEAVAAKKKVSLIVIATHGRTGLANKLMGSVAMKLLRHASTNMLVTKPSTLDFSWMKKEIYG